MAPRVCKLLAAALGLAAARKPFMTELKVQATEDAGSAGALCSPCVQIGEQGLNILLNYILQAGVVGSCGKLCSHLPNKLEQGACNIACDLVGVDAFQKALNNTDLDVIYFCETLKACQAGPDDAAASLASASAQPPSLAKGDTVTLQAVVDVTKATGVGQFLVGVDGPVTEPVSQGFLLPKGLPVGSVALSVQLQVQDDDSGDFPVVWSPGTYTFAFKVCQGECGSKHPHSKDFGEIKGTFQLTDVLGANPTHYGNPTGGCESDEMAVQVQGISGDFCSPSCTSSACPSDVPTGVLAQPQCALQTTTGDKYCALMCSSDSQCGTASCQSIMGVGICTYAASSESLKLLTEVAQADLVV